MSIYRENDCVGCDPCIGCGRNESYAVIECDSCGDTSMETSRKFIPISGGRHYCPACYLRNAIQSGDVKKIVCCECGDREAPYEYLGKSYCEYCLERLFEDENGISADDLAKSE